MTDGDAAFNICSGLHTLIVVVVESNPLFAQPLTLTLTKKKFLWLFSPDFTVATAGGIIPASSVAVGWNGATSADVIAEVNLNLANDKEESWKTAVKIWLSMNIW